MNMNNIQKNKNYRNKLNCNSCNNIHSNNCKAFNSPLNSLFEVENFLCNLNKVKKAIILGKFLNKF